MKQTDDEVRAMLEGAVADVEPRPALDRIRARTASSRRRAPALRIAATVLATAAVLVGVVTLGPRLQDISRGGAGDAGVAAGGPDRGSGTPAAPGGPTRLVYFVGDSGAGPRLFPEPFVAGSAGTALPEAVEAAASGRSADPDYRSPWPSGTVLQHAQLEAGVLAVDLSGPVVDRPAGMTQSDAELALQQLVHTAQAATGEPLPVTFLVDGRPSPTVLGVPTSRPVPARAAEETLSAVSVTSIVDGASARSPVTVEGRASAFEATVQWELLGEAGTVVRRGFTTARECCTLSPYSFRVTAPPGSYTLVVHDEDVSGGEGTAPTQDTKRLTIR